MVLSALLLGATACLSTPTTAQDVDPFIYGAYLGKLRWAENNCSGKISETILKKLESAKALNEDDFDDGRRAAGRAVDLDANASGTAAACREIMKLYGKRGSDLKGAFVAK